MADPFRLAFDIWALARAPLARYLPPLDIEQTDELIADRKGVATPRVMVFGTYNAGKSTLVNALVGKEVARVSDHPETDQITSYPWRGFMLDDTPGIDAPIEHERVTRAHMENVDIVLFVVATDGTLEEQRTLDEIVALAGSGTPLRLIINNKSGFRPDDMAFLGLRNRLADKLRRAADAAGITDIDRRAPICLVNAASALRGRLEGKQALLANSGMLDLEDDIDGLCAATGKAQVARTLCRRIGRQVDLALAGMPAQDETRLSRAAAERIAAERERLSAVLGQSVKVVTSGFLTELRQAVDKGDQAAAEAAASKAVSSVSAVLERELPRTRRVFEEVEAVFTNPVAAAPGVSIPLPGVATPEAAGGSSGFGFTDMTRLLAPALGTLDRDVLVGGLMAAKQAFPTVFKGLGPAFFGRLVPFIGPAIQTATGLYDAYAAHRDGQREFERAKERRLDLDQAVRGAAARLAWALEQQCGGIVEAVFGPAESALARQAAMLNGQAAAMEADRATLLQCRGRIAIALDEQPA